MRQEAFPLLHVAAFFRGRQCLYDSTVSCVNVFFLGSGFIGHHEFAFWHEAPIRLASQLEIQIVQIYGKLDLTT